MPTPHRSRIMPVLALAALAGCTAGPPPYQYGPASYAAPPINQPLPLAPPPPPITSQPLPAPGTFLPDRPPLEPLPAPAPGIDVPPPEATVVPEGMPPGTDPVMDVLLGPPAAARTPPPSALPEAPVVKAPSAPEANPLMGFRPMRGQTPPSRTPSL